MKGSLRLQFFKWLCLYTIMIIVTMAVLLAAVVYSSFAFSRFQYDQDVSRDINELYYMLLYAFPVFMFLFLLGAAWIISRRLTQPLSNMVRATQIIRRGDLGHRIEPQLYEDEVRTLAETLNEAFDRYQDALNRLDRFSSNVSHQFKNPLAAIKTLGETALKQARSVDEYQDTLGRMLEETSRLNRTVEQLLLLSRLSDENYRESMESFNLSQHIKNVIDDFAVACEVKGIDFSNDLAPKIEIAGIANLIQEALLNLLDNAVRHTPEGGKIRVTLREKGNASRIVLSVCDSGEGTSMTFPALLTKTRDQHSDGHGLGLAIVRDIAQLHKGTVQCEKSQFGGASFVIELPLNPM